MTSSSCCLSSLSSHSILAFLQVSCFASLVRFFGRSAAIFGYMRLWSYIYKGHYGNVIYKRECMSVCLSDSFNLVSCEARIGKFADYKVPHKVICCSILIMIRQLRKKEWMFTVAKDLLLRLPQREQVFSGTVVKAVLSVRIWRNCRSYFIICWQSMKLIGRISEMQTRTSY